MASPFVRMRRLIRAAAVAFVLALGSGCASGPWWQGLTAEQLWAKGTAEFESGDHGDAAETLGRLLLQFPGFDEAAEAQFLLAQAYYEDRQYISAQSEYTRFVDRYPTHPRAPDAALGVCRANEELSPISQRDQTFTEQAIEVCSGVATDWAGTAQAVEAAQIVRDMREKLAKKAYENAHYYHRRTLLDPALIYYEDLVETYPETSWAPKALVAMMEIYTAFGYDDEVAATRNRLLDEYPESPEAKAVSGNGDARPGG